MRSPPLVFLTLAFVAVLATWLLPSTSVAQSRDQVVIRSSQAPIGYQFELEPHIVLGTDPPGPGAGSGAGIGARASVVIAPGGFIRNLNDSVALGFGLDISHYSAAWSTQGQPDQCLRFAPGPGGTRVCTEVTSNGGSYNYIYLPAVMQWNFWLTGQWSVFGEPGLDLYYVGNHGFSVSPALYVGGRFQVSERITLTARLGYPSFTFGASFMM